MRRAVFLDRDGTINSMVYNPEFGLVDSPSNPGEFKLLSGVGEAIRLIKKMGFMAIVVSNQPGVAKGKFTKQIMEATTCRMNQLLSELGAELDAIYYCMHHPQAVIEEYKIDCECRKPKPGLLKKAAREMDIDLDGSYLVGDGITDILAGREAGVIPIFIGNSKPYVWDEMSRQNVCPDYVVGNLMQAVHVIRKVEDGDGCVLDEFIPPIRVSSSAD